MGNRVPNAQESVVGLFRTVIDRHEFSGVTSSVR
jgi:hypothetical protein